MSARSLAVAALALAACSASTPAPPLGAHSATEDAETVPIDAPPGKVQVLSPPPPTMKSPLWIDGEWEWKGRRWSWKEGRWEEPPAGMCCWAPARTERRADGTFSHRRGAWTKERAAK